MNSIVSLLISLMLHSYLCASQSHLAEHLNHVIEPPLFTSGRITHLTSLAIMEELTPILREHLSATNYNRLFLTNNLIRHLKNSKSNQNQSYLIKLRTYKYPTDISNYRGGPCVPLTLDLYRRIPKEFNAYIIAAKLPDRYQQFAFPTYCHSAILIHFINSNDFDDEGYVLLDPSFDFDEPIIVKEGKITNYELPNKTKFSFWLDDSRILCQIYPAQDSSNYHKDNYLMIYRLDQLLNPVESSGLPMLLVDRRLSLLSRRENGEHIAHLNVELDKRRIIWDHHYQHLDPILFPSFNHFNFPIDFAADLFISPRSLKEIIQYLILNLDIVDSLYIEYLTFIKELKDYSITGPLSDEEIDKRIENLISLNPKLQLRFCPE